VIEVPGAGKETSLSAGVMESGLFLDKWKRTFAGVKFPVRNGLFQAEKIIFSGRTLARLMMNEHENTPLHVCQGKGTGP
jgi:hypothetical protein